MNVMFSYGIQFLLLENLTDIETMQSITSIYISRQSCSGERLGSSCIRVSILINKKHYLSFVPDIAILSRSRLKSSDEAGIM